MRTARIPALAALAVAVLVLSGCSTFRKSQPTALVGDDVGAGSDGVAGQGLPLDADATTLLAKGAGDARRCVADLDCNAGERCQAGACAATDCRALPTVYFAFDRADLTEEAASAARLLAHCIRERGLRSASIEGFADERGATEYNLALSYKRAQALRSALVSEGVAIPLKVVAWGEAFPAAQGNDEASWAENRRAFATPAGELLADKRRRAGN